MRYVLDSCVAFKWVVPEADSDKALRLHDDYLAGGLDLIAPDVYPVEVTHALTRAERRGRISVGEASNLLVASLGTLPDLEPSLDLLTRACDISSAHRVGVYDCLYVALAEREGCALVTADARLVSNLAARFPFLTPLSALP